MAGGVAGVGDWVGVGWASPSPQCSLSVILSVGGVVSDDVASGGGGVAVGDAEVGVVRPVFVPLSLAGLALVVWELGGLWMSSGSWRQWLQVALGGSYPLARWGRL